MNRQTAIKNLQEGKIVITLSQYDNWRHFLTFLKEVFPKSKNVEKLAPSHRCYYKAINMDIWLSGISVRQDRKHLPVIDFQDIIDEKEFVLPQKWAVEHTPAIRKDLVSFLRLNNYPVGAIEDNSYFLYHFPFTESGGSAYNRVLDGYTRITSEQFLKYVLKQETVKKTIVGYILKPAFKGLERAAANIAFDNNQSTLPDWIRNNSICCDRLIKAKILDIWFEPVYEEIIKFPKINGYEGKLSQDGLIEYGCAKLNILFLKNILDVEPRLTNGVGNRTLKAIVLDSNVSITVEQVKQIVKAYEFHKKAR